ncbi:MAG: hypothetical protein IJN63_03150, partial [Clostridia bacterium]|nr:hypothetical protein [Clostridia bacterium]
MITFDSENLVFEGFNAVKAAICGIESGFTGRNVVRVLFSKKRVAKKRYELSWLNVRAATLGFELVLCDESEVASLCSTDSHGGVVGILTARQAGGADALRDLASSKERGWFLCLEGIE